MQTGDAFGIALRVLGLWFLYLAAYDGVFLARRFSGLMNGVGAQITEDKIMIGFHLFLALIFLAGADKIVRLFYPRAA